MSITFVGVVVGRSGSVLTSTTSATSTSILAGTSVISASRPASSTGTTSGGSGLCGSLGGSSFGDGGDLDLLVLRVVVEEVKHVC